MLQFSHLTLYHVQDYIFHLLFKAFKAPWNGASNVLVPSGASGEGIITSIPKDLCTDKVQALSLEHTPISGGPSSMQQSSRVLSTW